MNYDYALIVEPLIEWFEQEKRILPWRSNCLNENPKPYYVWISEIMLQQTRVEAVKEYFYRFTKEQEQLYKQRHAEFYLKSFATSGVQFRFRTDSKKLYLKCLAFIFLFYRTNFPIK